MTSGLPVGFVDPTDPAQVEPVLARVLDQLGLAGVIDLLARLPGVGLQPGRPGGLVRRAEPPRLLSAGHVLVLGAPVRDEHIVGGIVLSHRDVPRSELPGLLAGCVCAATRADGRTGDAGVQLTSIRDALAG